MLIAGIIPGLIHAFMYMVLVFIRCKINPSLIPKGPQFTWKEKFVSIPRAWGLIFIVVVVMGGIYTGIFTPIEAAAVGTFAAFVAVMILKKGTFSAIRTTLLDSATMTSSIVFIIISGMMFGNLLALSRLPVMISEYIAGLNVPPIIIMIIIMAFYIILGAFMDALSTLIITIPIIFPAITALGYDPIWFGVLITITIEVALVSPPYGLNLFMMHATVPDIRMAELYRGVVWFIVFDILTLAIMIAFPQLSLWLPNLMIGR
jgi:tripartite ATP-independent transporter DctM subunit